MASDPYSAKGLPLQNRLRDSGDADADVFEEPVKGLWKLTDCLNTRLSGYRSLVLERTGAGAEVCLGGIPNDDRLTSGLPNRSPAR